MSDLSVTIGRGKDSGFPLRGKRRADEGRMKPCNPHREKVSTLWEAEQPGSSPLHSPARCPPQQPHSNVNRPRSKNRKRHRGAPTSARRMVAAARTARTPPAVESSGAYRGGRPTTL